MKIAAPQSTKFLKLKRRLAIPHWQCVGLLESLWLFTQHNAPLGDIGRHSDEDLAAAIEWAGDTGELVTALIECGWLDVCDVNRLVVHDWEEHAPTYIKGAIARHGKDFCRAVKKSAKQGAKQGARGGQKKATPPPQHPAPNHTKPNLTKPSEAPPNPPPAVAGAGGGQPRDEVFDFLTALTGSDPKAHASRIGRLKKLLLAATPPHTLAEIRTLADPAFLARELPYLRGTKPSLNQIEGVIGRIRNPSPQQPNQRPPPHRPQTPGEREMADLNYHLGGIEE